MKLNVVHNVDCLKFMKTMPAKSVDLIIADPPYKFESRGRGLVRKGGYHDRIREKFGHNFNPIPYLNGSKRLMRIYNSYWWTSKNNLPVYLNWAVENKFNFNLLMWHKNNPPPLKSNNYLPDTEYCLYIKDKGAYFNSKLPKSFYSKYWITAVQQNPDHPTPKPREIIQKNIIISSKPGSLVFDPFMGSGTTAEGAKELGRNFIGCEINTGDFVEINKRLSQQVIKFKK